MVSSEYWFGAEASFYNGVATQSLRIHDGDNASISWTPSSAGNRKKWTFSTWLKRSTITDASSGDQYIFSQTTGTNNNDSFMALIFRGDDLDVTCASLEVLRSNAKFRDVGAWYHILWVLDTQNATDAHKMRLYVNGDEITSFSGDERSNSQLDGTDMPILNNGIHYIGKNGNNTTQNFDGYLAYTELVEGQALTPSDFTEVKNGALIPKEYTGDHGTYGFRLEYKETGDGSSSPSTSTIGADTKSNATKQHWNDNNLDTWDSNLPDSPENNFCTYNPLDAFGNANTFSEGNLGVVVSAQNTNEETRATFGVSSGKWYWEHRLNSSTTTVGYFKIGIKSDDGSNYWNVRGSDGELTNNGSTTSSSVSYNTAGASGNVIGVYLDMDNGKWYVSVDGTLQNSADLSAGTGYLHNNISGTVHPYILNATSGGTHTGIGNFGQDSSFAGNETATSNTDSNGRGTFHSAVTSPYLALCSANISDDDLPISPSATTQAVDHFGTLTYTGTGTTNNIRSGDVSNGVGGEINFQPDFTWIKSRQSTNNHNLFDSNRGAGIVLYSHLNYDEDDTTAYFTDFAVNGFNLASNGGDTNYFTSGSGYTYVAWNWLANGTTPSKTYKVVVVSDSGNKYRFRNSADDATFAQSAVTLNLQEGGTYTFDLSDSSMSGHPFVFSTTSNGTHGGGSEYTTGVTKTGTAGSAGASIVITVASSAPTLYYYCSNHSGMGGQVNTNETHGSTNFDGSILSVSNANTTAGFSVVTYTGDSTGNNGTANTIGHGLNAVPKFIWTLPRDTNDGAVYHAGNTSAPETERLILKSTSSGNLGTSDDASFWDDTEPSSTVFSVGTRKHTNSSGGIVAYCFAEVEGYSKFGSYTGNGATDGTFVYTGFRPAWVLMKPQSTTGDWELIDSVREPFNDLSANKLEPNNSGDESLRVNDFFSNGFKVSGSGNTNANNVTYIYIAFAETPFKYANAR